MRKFVILINSFWFLILGWRVIDNGTDLNSFTWFILFLIFSTLIINIRYAWEECKERPQSKNKIVLWYKKVKSKQDKKNHKKSLFISLLSAIFFYIIARTELDPSDWEEIFDISIEELVGYGLLSIFIGLIAYGLARLFFSAFSDTEENMTLK